MYTEQTSIQRVSSTPHFARGFLLARRVRLAAAVSTLALLIVGCPPDTRINAKALRAKEQDLRNVEPVLVTDDNLKLTDFRPYQVSPGDVLKVTLTGLSENYEGTLIRARVHADGKINLPLVGKVNTQGLELEAIERAIVAAYVPDYIKSLSAFVELDETDQTTIMVAGAGGAHKLVTLPRNQRNVLYALEKAGDFGEGASSRVCVFPVRAGREPASYNLTDVNDLRRALVAAPLEPGDMVFVEAADTSAVFVTGLLNSPGPIPLPNGSRLTVMRAIAAAGGLVDFLSPSEATLWRQMPDGEQVRVKLNLDKILSGQDEDLAVYAGDILDVPQTAKTRFLQWVVENVQIGPFGMTAMYDPILEHRARLFNNNSGGGFLQSVFGQIPINAQAIGNTAAGAAPAKTKGR